MRRFDAVIFDMDGVLIDSEPLHFGVLNQILAQDGVALSRADNERFLGTTTQITFGALVAEHSLPHGIPEYTARYDAALLRVLSRPHEPQPGVVALIDRLRGLGLRLGVASSSRSVWIAATLRSLGLADAFDTLVSGDDVEHGKPDPAIYALAARRLGVPPERCLAIEDSPNGVRSARDAGMAVLGVRTAYTAHLDLEGAERTVDSLAELDLSGEVFS